MKRIGLLGVLLAVGISGCTPVAYQRNVYRTSGDCILDYTDALCQTSWTGAGMHRIYGPVYRTVGGRPEACDASDPGAGRSSREAARGVTKANRVAIEVVPRGGLGTMCPSTAPESRSRPWWGRRD
jgi:hypothetical protein